MIRKFYEADVPGVPSGSAGTATAQDELDQKKGAFVGSLTRGNKQIRADRALAITEDAQMIYAREVQDIRANLKKMRRERENMLDMSPDNAQSLKLASDFDAKQFVSKDLELGIRIRNEEIKLDIAEARYFYLFGEKA